MKQDTQQDVRCGAEFSSCRRYRYALWRDWDWQGYANRIMFIGLNPSTADETEDDPTIRRCIGFAKRWGYGGILMMNAYAYRSTDPKKMKAASDPVGPSNDEALSYQSNACGMIVAAWGNHIEPARAVSILRVLRGSGPVQCLGKNKNGTPKHPLYLKGDTPLIRFTP